MSKSLWSFLLHTDSKKNSGKWWPCPYWRSKNKDAGLHHPSQKCTIPKDLKNSTHILLSKDRVRRPNGSTLHWSLQSYRMVSKTLHHRTTRWHSKSCLHRSSETSNSAVNTTSKQTRKFTIITTTTNESLPPPDRILPVNRLHLVLRSESVLPTKTNTTTTTSD